MTALLILAGAMVGAPVRFLVDRAVQNQHGSVFPWGTWAVNVGGSFLLGLVVAAALPPAVAAGLGTGFCSALTTYSTFGYETVRLAERGCWFHAAGNVVAGLGAGLGSAVTGAMVGLAVWG
ncbi:MAG: fluoride efflux transporter CrcB [Micromonosporaceae bacterium]|nr:fluoride efflux transporter CrcB [Micromonosporaceae bacterium]